MNLKIRILSGILAGSMLCSFVPVKAIGDEPTDINIVEKYMSYMYNANDMGCIFLFSWETYELHLWHSGINQIIQCFSGFKN